MKTLTILMTLISMNIAYAQPVGGCCKVTGEPDNILGKQVDDIVPVANSCIICPKVSILNKSKYRKHIPGDSSTQAMEVDVVVTVCRAHQDSLINETVELLKEIQKATNSEVTSFEEALDYMAFFKGMKVNEVVKDNDINSNISRKCNMTVGSKEYNKAKKKVSKATEQLKVITKFHKEMTQMCAKIYTTSEQEIKLMNRAKELAGSAEH